MAKHFEQSQYAESDRICDIMLDDTTIKYRSAEVQHERNVALFDLKEKNIFRPSLAQEEGPFKLYLSIQDGRKLIFECQYEDGSHAATVILSLQPFKRLIKDYFDICASYYEAIKTKTPQQIETIDMARRGLHNEGADLMEERLVDKLEFDPQTGRRLFTLICVLHYRG